MELSPVREVLKWEKSSTLRPATRLPVASAAAELNHFCYAKIGIQTVLAEYPDATAKLTPCPDWSHRGTLLPL